MKEEEAISWSCAVTKQEDFCYVLLCAPRRKDSLVFPEENVF